MTQKELSYASDAICHQDIIIEVIQVMLNNLSDDKLISFMDEELNIHTLMREKLISKLEEKTNE